MVEWLPALEVSTTKSVCPWFTPLWMTWMTENRHKHQRMWLPVSFTHKLSNTTQLKLTVLVMVPSVWMEASNWWWFHNIPFPVVTVWEGLRLLDWAVVQGVSSEGLHHDRQVVSAEMCPLSLTIEGGDLSGEGAWHTIVDLPSPQLPPPTVPSGTDRHNKAKPVNEPLLRHEPRVCHGMCTCQMLV